MLQYEIRPAKAVQRRMIAHALSRLSFVENMSTYRYVGFGALEFIDFDLFHRALGIESMVSIERDTSLKERYEQNAPFRGIEVRMGCAHEVLPSLDWSPISIVWLDYTEQLTREITTDVEFVARSARPGSVLVVTVNAEPSRPRTSRLSTLVERLGPCVPSGLDDETLGGWGLASVQRSILQDIATQATRDAHGGTLKQLFNFNYADGARMQTWGGIVSSSGVSRSIEACRFEDLDFIRLGEDPCRLVVPVVTAREAALIESQLPVQDGADPKVPGMTADDVRDYINVYRWHRSNPGVA
jgi:Putative O-methyltransferase